MIEETIKTVDLSDHATLMECYVGLNKSFRKQKERIAALEAALKPFVKVLEWNCEETAPDDWYLDNEGTLTVGILRAARAAYLGEKE